MITYSPPILKATLPSFKWIIRRDSISRIFEQNYDLCLSFPQIVTKQLTVPKSPLDPGADLALAQVHKWIQSLS